MWVFFPSPFPWNKKKNAIVLWLWGINTISLNFGDNSSVFKLENTNWIIFVRM